MTLDVGPNYPQERDLPSPVACSQPASARLSFELSDADDFFGLNSCTWTLKQREFTA